MRKNNLVNNELIEKERLINYVSVVRLQPYRKGLDWMKDYVEKKELKERKALLD